ARPRGPIGPCAGGSMSLQTDWPIHAGSYSRLIDSEQSDARVLRRLGLLPNLLEILGEVSRDDLLDAGTGTNWLFDHIRSRGRFACDLVRPSHVRRGVRFSVEDIHSLSFAAAQFDTIVASLVLMYCDD